MKSKANFFFVEIENGIHKTTRNRENSCGPHQILLLDPRKGTEYRTWGSEFSAAANPGTPQIREPRLKICQYGDDDGYPVAEHDGHRGEGLHGYTISIHVPIPTNT